MLFKTYIYAGEHDCGIKKKLKHSQIQVFLQLVMLIIANKILNEKECKHFQ